MKTWITCILLVFFALPSCIQEDEGPDPAVVARGVEIRINNYRERRARECREKALERADVIADSLIALMAFEMKDTIPRPERLRKPEKPVFATPPDSLKPTPILDPDTLK